MTILCKIASKGFCTATFEIPASTSHVSGISQSFIKRRVHLSSTLSSAVIGPLPVADIYPGRRQHFSIHVANCEWDVEFRAIYGDEYPFQRDEKIMWIQKLQLEIALCVWVRKMGYFRGGTKGEWGTCSEQLKAARKHERAGERSNGMLGNEGERSGGIPTIGLQAAFQISRHASCVM